MASWSNATVTAKGYALQAKLLSTNPLVITKVVAGSGRVTAGQLVNQTTVSEEEQTLTVEALSYDDKGNAIIKTSLNNKNLTSGYTCNQIGIYASDPDEGEILYAISQEATAGEGIPSITEQPNGYYCSWVFSLTFSNSSNISVTIDPANALTKGAADVFYAEKSHTHNCSDIGAAPEGLVSEVYSVATEDELKTVLTDTVKGMSNRSSKLISCKFTAEIFRLGTGTWQILVNKDYTYSANALMFSCGAEITKVFTCSYDGSWHDYNNLTFPGRDLSNVFVTYPDNWTGSRCEPGAEIFNDYERRTVDHNTSIPLTGNVALGFYSHAEGHLTTAVGDYSHAEGYFTKADWNASHAEGYETDAIGYYSHSEGYKTLASSSGSHAEGYETAAKGLGSHSEGGNTLAKGYYSHAGGYKTTANDYQFVTGKNNKEVAGAADRDEQSADSSIFMIGYGTLATPANAMRVSSAGKCYGASAFLGSGADFPEFEEWADGNPNNEDRRGRFAALEGDKIVLASSEKDHIIGVISVMGAFIANSASENWQGMYKKDVFGENLTQQVEIPEKTIEKKVFETDEEGNRVEKTITEVIPAHTITQFVVNPDYNPDEEYIGREFRKEWAPVGKLGQVIVVDDGTCTVGGYCKPSANGIGTAGEYGYYVRKRIDSTHIKVEISPGAFNK